MTSPIICFLLGMLGVMFTLQGTTAQAPFFTVLYIASFCGIIILLFKRETQKKCIIALIIGVCIGSVRLHLPDMIEQKNLLIGQRTIEGCIAEAPEKRPTFARYIVQSSGANILVTDRTYWPEFHVGDCVRITGKVEMPTAGKDMDYGRYLASQGIVAIMNAKRIERQEDVIPPASLRYSPLLILVPIREWFEGEVQRLLPEPHASLMAGLLTGSRVGLSPKLSDNFRRVGLTHIIAISGSNITIILSIFSSLLFWIPRKKRFVPLSIGIILFTIFVGAGAPVIRACIMGVLGLIGLQTERTPKTIVLILWTGCFMTLWNPRMIVADPGFQLSFLATIGITLFSKKIMRYLTLIPEWIGMRESLGTTLAAQLATLPVSILIFRQFSIVAPLSNLLVAPLIPLAMLFGFVGTIVFTVTRIPGLMIGYIAWLILNIILHIVNILSAIPYASVQW